MAKEWKQALAVECWELQRKLMFPGLIYILLGQEPDTPGSHTRGSLVQYEIAKARYECIASRRPDQPVGISGSVENIALGMYVRPPQPHLYPRIASESSVPVSLYPSNPSPVPSEYVSPTYTAPCPFGSFPKRLSSRTGVLAVCWLSVRTGSILA